METVTDIQSIISGAPIWTYVTIFFSAIILGNISAFLTFWLASFGYFGSWGVLITAITVFIADVCGDTLWFWLGRTLRETKLGHFIKNHISRMKHVKDYVNEDTIKLMFLAKFVSSTNTPLVFLAGWAKVNFKKFIRVSLFAIANWFIIIFTIIYLLRPTVGPILPTNIIGKIEIILLIGVATFFISHLLAHRLTKKVAVKKWSEKAAGFVSKKEN